jgi:hypothetical protein
MTSQRWRQRTDRWNRPRTRWRNHFHVAVKWSRNTVGSPSLNQTAGYHHVDPHPGHDLSAIPQGRYRGFDKRLGTAMIEAATALLAFLSVGVFLAHAFDAYRMR